MRGGAFETTNKGGDNTDEFTWKAEIAFEGTAREFARLKKSMDELSLKTRDITKRRASDEKGTWKAEIVFKGTAQEFNRMARSLEEFPILIYIPEWLLRPWHLAGCYPLGPPFLLGERRFAEFTEGMPRIKIDFIRPIPGGIRTPHIHVDGDVVLVDRDRFKKYVGEVAQKLAEMRVEKMEDYVEVMRAVGQLHPEAE